MAYEPPVYTAVDFTAEPGPYTPPPYTLVDFFSGAIEVLAVVEGSTTAFDLMFADVAAPNIQTVYEGASAAVDTSSATRAVTASVTEGAATASDAPSCGFLRASSVAEGAASAADSTDATLVPFVPQYEDIFPIADVGGGLWRPSVGSEFWPVLDEPNAPNFSDFIYSPPNPTSEPFELRFAPLPDYGGNDRYHSIDLALEAINFDTVFDFELRESATVLDTWSEAVSVAQGEVVRSRAFDPAVIALITNRADVRIRGVAHA